MNKKILASSVLCLASGLACASSYYEDVYGGLKFSGRSMGFKNQYGSIMFPKKTLPQYSLFGGVNFNHWLGAEAELFTTNNKTRSVTINEGATELGYADFAGIFGNDAYNTKTKLSGVNLLLTARHKVAHKLHVFAAAGVGISRMNLKAEMTLDSGTNASALQQNGNRINQRKTKMYPVVNVGADYRLTRHFGIRANVGWENTARFKWSFQTNPPGVATRNLSVRAKNSVVYGIGVYIAS